MANRGNATLITRYSAQRLGRRSYYKARPCRKVHEKYMNDGEPGGRGRGVAPKTKEAMAARPMGTGDAPFIGADMDDDEGIIHQERRVSSAQSQISNQRGGGLHPNF